MADHPRWADGWTQPKSPIGKHKASASEGEASNLVDASDDTGRGMHSEGGGGGSQPSPKGRLGGSKAAKEDARSASAREGAIYAQADATRSMVAAQMKKAALLEDQNMLMLMIMLDDQVTIVEAREYLRLRKGDELKNLRRELAFERGP